ncbi:CxxxxCH/CxxCH domain c-type cytochrome [Desulfuromonas acetexigens]|uniref:CxxxxCH/CxxCH domain c-type cytochrome n=1 Tax=Trichloromonas acetexigens TaxID=38815 RepID=UPI001478DD16|nr:CxxxxCH/CxxCH domain-containing protein [Desulfuromonas acetexigens]
MTCTRCHDPHKLKDGFNLEASTNKLLRMNSPDAMCLDCHRDWNMAGNRGLLTHPLVKDYPAFVAAEANKFKYKSVDGYNSATLVLPSNEGSGQVRMVYNSVDATGTGSGPMNVSCTSCHGVHFTDSDSSTVDGKGKALNSGDGKLLLSDGPRRTHGDPIEQGKLRSNLCQACHVYKKHGDVNGNDNGMFAGCLDCHSGHVYHATSPNYFVLRKSVEDVFIPKQGAVGSASGLEFTTLEAAWANGTNTGYCQGCHTLNFPHNGVASGTHGKASCVNCHFHNNETGSFVADCSACHGFPPIYDEPGNITLGGYAIDEDNYRSYKFLDTRDQNILRDIYKLESQTPHKRHAAGGSDYGFGCDNCHAQAFSGATPTHLNGYFQDVNFGALASAGTYDTAGGGACATVYCHSNGNAASLAYASVTWQETAGTITGCTACHGNDAATMVTTGNTASHQKHLGAGGGMGKSYACNVCHVATAESATTLVAASRAVGGAHVNGQGDVDFVSSGGVLYNALSVGEFSAADNTCNVYCHGYDKYTIPDWDDPWGGAASDNCSKCHSATPTSGSHTAHISTTGANIGCADCHGVGANTGAHAGHVNGAIDYLDFAASCKACHTIEDGDVALVWGNQATATCDACHGGVKATSYTDASNSPREAPTWPAYVSAGHGKTGVVQLCTGCHSTDTDTAHMNGIVGDTSRLAMVNGKTYTAEAPNAFCGACHDGGSGNEKGHYATGAGHTSTDGTRCNACHDPHGYAGYDAMIKDSIDGRAVATFADRTSRAAYANASFNGVCQVCHAGGAVNHFSLTAYNSGHGGTRPCLDCHSHSAEAAFEVTCYSCHGGANIGSTSGNKNFWPDGVREHTANQAGEHEVHVLKIAERINPSWTSVQTLLNGATNAQQKQICEYCHAAVNNDNDHASVSTAEVFVAQIGDPAVETRFAKKIWYGLADSGATYSDGSCSAVACHNGKTTDVAYKWYAGGSTACTMCHNGETVPTSGSHVPHLQNMVTFASGYITCADCHSDTEANSWIDQTPPSTNHINGSVNVDGSRGLIYTGSYPTTKGSCGTNSCHNNGKNQTPNVNYVWGTSIGRGCESCHTNSAEGHMAHFNSTGTFVEWSVVCTKCHTNHVSSNQHFNGSVNFLSTMNYNGEVVVGDAGFGTCTTTTCHQDGKGVAVETPMWNRTPSSADDCTLCHAAKPTTGSHNQHVVTGATAYGATGNTSTTTTYDFKCGECHGNTLANHIDGSASFGAVGWQSAGKTCDTSYCHSNGAAPPDYKASPAWGTSFAPDEDPCAGCHGNSPNTNAHAAHVVAIHWDSDVSKNRSGVYTGTTGLQGAANSDASAHGKVDTSTTINCNVCHNDTVTRWRNRQNTACVGCHSTDTPEDGNAVIKDKSKHVNGVADVKLLPIKMKTRAQIRNDIKTVPELDVTWQRFDAPGGILGLFYKGADNHDQARTIFNTATMYDGTTKTCTNISCHNGNQVKWSDNLSCDGCHTQLP